MMKIFQIPPAQAPMALLLEADPSERVIQRYLPSSHCFVGEMDGRLVGVYVLSPVAEQQMELLNIAIAEDCRGCGLGQQLLQDAIARARELGARTLTVGTGTFGYPIEFYQKAGFQIKDVDHGYFLRHYAEPLIEEGQQHKDRVNLFLNC